MHQERASDFAKTLNIYSERISDLSKQEKETQEKHKAAV